MNNAAACAFPTGAEGDPGLTKREYFAAMAMQGFASNPDACDSRHHKSIAMAAIEWADSLLAVLEATQYQHTGASHG